ncbi:heme o synthase [Sulfobacillus harzensis]|uniref:Protoheme IX farnesyltransferase n=1 Tax=Sulfobacillus harzensis TaxID=2729629 RepID=A0A7Y0L067_9FIRM|nr:heme o synthase [Sulfobacillus harzensis]NMP20858.1 protoheme IX farnesyltransferase [Sulfobacillus harzensis]
MLKKVQETGRAYLELTKPGIVVWLLITAYCAMIVGHRGIPPLAETVYTLVGLGMSAGGAHAVNMWYDRDIDQVMRRTRRRPVVTGRVSPTQALTFGIVLGAVAFVGMGTLVNWLAASASLGGYLFYVFVYTMWLKRRSPQNIVIGGAAGAFPPIVGWAGATGHLGLASGLMFLLIFMWTPPHFWSLALYKQDDYRNAKIPMMPIVRGPRSTKIQSLVYALLSMAVSIALYLTHTVGRVYLGAAVVLGIAFVVYNIRLLREPPGELAWAKKTFRFSLIYIAALFVAMVV